jgi:hypothetical protein
VTVYLTREEQGAVSLFLKSLYIPGEADRRTQPITLRRRLTEIRNQRRCLYCGAFDCPHPLR